MNICLPLPSFSDHLMPEDPVFFLYHRSAVSRVGRLIFFFGFAILFSHFFVFVCCLSYIHICYLFMLFSLLFVLFPPSSVLRAVAACRQRRWSLAAVTTLGALVALGLTAALPAGKSSAVAHLYTDSAQPAGAAAATRPHPGRGCLDGRQTALHWVQSASVGSVAALWQFGPQRKEDGGYGVGAMT